MQTEGGSASTMGAKENAGAPGGATVGGEGLISAWDGWAAEDAWRVMRERHSVRSYTSRRIEGKVLAHLREVIAEVNKKAGLSFTLVTDDPAAFDGRMAHYGKFQGVRNHIALIGPKGAELAGQVGFWGEQVALEAQRSGLNTCWVAMTYRPKASVALTPGQGRPCVLALGYGETQGVAHTSKPAEKLTRVGSEHGLADAPAWFRAGVEAAQLAPTAMNQQKFSFELVEGNAVRARAGVGPYAKVDLGIVRCHFQLAANAVSRDWHWARA